MQQPPLTATYNTTPLLPPQPAHHYHLRHLLPPQAATKSCLSTPAPPHSHLLKHLAVHHNTTLLPPVITSTAAALRQPAPLHQPPPWQLHHLHQPPPPRHSNSDAFPAAAAAMAGCGWQISHHRHGITNYGYWLWIVSSGWSSVSIVLGQMTYPIASLTLDSVRSYVIHGASFTQGIVSSIPIGGSISPEGFLLLILLLVVIIVTVVIVVVILIVVVAIVGVVIAIIGVVVVVGGNPSIKASISYSVFGTMFGHKTANSWNLL
nr:hypothetical protein [Tanacetum cinerariifolium]